MGDSTYSSHKTTILSSIPQKQPSLKDRDFSKLHILNINHLTQFSKVKPHGL